MKKTFKQWMAGMLSVLMIISYLPLTAFAWTGSGTESDPYLIYTLKDLEDFRNSVNAGNTYEGKYIKLMNDITMNTPDMFSRDAAGNITGAAEGKKPYEWTPIGTYTSSSDNKPFSGTFDGDGHKIIGIYIVSKRIDYQGLFGYCKNVTMKNLGVADGYVYGKYYVGSVVGYCNADSGTSTVTNCYNTGTVRGLQNVGGVAGDGFSASGSTVTIINCYNTGTVIGDDEVGGVVGSFGTYSGTAKVNDCYNTGTVSGGNNYVGGVVGRNFASSEGTATVTNCFNIGAVNGFNYVGGVIGYCIHDTIVNKCYNAGEVSGNSRIGGVVGYNYAEKNTDEAIVKDCHNTGKISSIDGFVGGVVGSNRSGDGIATVSNCYNTGTVGDYAAGGVVGDNQAQNGTAIVTNCYNTGAIGNNDAGGVVGYNYAGSSTGVAKISSCYNTGNVSGSSYIGGVVGQNYSYGTIAVDNCYYLTDTATVGYENNTFSSGTITVDNITALTDAQMRTQSNFVGFDFDTVWTMDGEPDYYYPELRLAAAPSNESSGDDIWDGSVATGFESGSGTEDDPYIIKTAAQLAYLAQTTNAGNSYTGKFLKLTNDITLNSVDMFARDTDGNITGAAEGKTPYEWIPIGIKSNGFFSGTFDGNNHTVKGIYINSESWYQGLFGYCENAFIQNLGVVEGFVKGKYFVGGIIGSNLTYSSDTSAVIINCHNTCTVNGSAEVGGVAGYVFGTTTVKNCCNDGNISGAEDIGGVVGYQWASFSTATVENCYNTGNVQGNGECIGGVVGKNYAFSDMEIAMVKNCYNTGTVRGTDYYVGGVVGYSGSIEKKSKASVIGCHNTGTVYGDYVVGGVVATNQAASGTAIVEKCYNRGAVNGSYYIGGLVGSNGTDSDTARAMVTNCYNTSIISGNAFVGGVIGFSHASSGMVNVENCYNINTVCAGDYVGGVLGCNKADSDSATGIIRNCYYLVGIASVGDNNYISGDGIITKENVTSLSDEQMQIASSFVGFDFDDVWTMEGDPDYPYPELNGFQSNLTEEVTESEREPTAAEWFAYTNNGDGTITITGYTGTDVEVVIPSTIDDNLVTAIDDYAFSNSIITSIFVPSSVRTIGYNAFSGCYSLANVDISEGVENIGEFAFGGCSSLKNITLPNSLISIGWGAFDGTGLNALTIPDNVTYLPRLFYYNCTLSEITIGSGVTRIEEGAFGSGMGMGGGISRINVSPDNANYASVDGVLFSKDMKTLIQYPTASLTTSYDIPNGVTTISMSAFMHADNLANITIPNTVVTIGDWAFEECGSLVSVTVPDSVKTIGNYAFGYCANLKNLTIGNGVTYLPQVFSGCSLINLTIGSGVEEIEDGSFLYGNGVSIANFTVSTENTHYASVDGVLFSKDLKTLIQYPTTNTMTEYTIPDGVTNIRGYSFEYANNLTKITIPDSVTTIGEYAFSQCKSLADVTIGNGLTIIENGLFSGCSALSNITISEGVESIGKNAFSGCTALIEFIIPDSVTRINHLAFSGCSNLKSIIIPKNMQFIEAAAFANCSKLTSITFVGHAPAFAQTYNSFNGVTAKAYYPANDPTWTSSVLRSYTVTTGKLTWTPYYLEHEHDYVAVTTAPTCTEQGYTTYTCSVCKENYISDYTDAIGHDYQSVVTPPTCIEQGYTTHTCTRCGYAYIDEYTPETGHTYASGVCINCGENEGVLDRGVCGDNLKWTFDDTGTLIITGTGAMYDYSESWYGYNQAPWGSEYERILTVVIGDGVTSIGNYAFKNCYNIASISIPGSVTSIGDSAFGYCSNLASITIPDGVVRIGDGAFNGTGLIEITLPRGIDSISNYLFGYCENLKTVTLSGSINRIGWSAFSNCRSLESFVLPEGITSIESNTFENCSSLKNINIPNSVISIYMDAFMGCSALKSINIPSSTTYIEWSAFRYCSGLESIAVESGNSVYHSSGNCLIETESKTLMLGCNNSVIPGDGSVTSIGDGAFYGCRELTEISIPESVTSIGYSAFEGCSGLTEINIPKNVTYIGGSAFSGCSKIKSISIPEGVTKIESYTFSNCSDLQSVTLPNSLKTIEWLAFRSSSKFSDVYYVGIEEEWNSVSINNSYGYNSELLRATVHFIPECDHYFSEWEITNPATCTKNGTQSKTCSICGKIITKTIPAGHKYDTSEVIEPTCDMYGCTKHICSVCGDISEDNYVEPLGHTYENGICARCGQPAKCGENLTWILDSSGNLTIRGTGEMSDYIMYDMNAWYNQRSSIKTVTVESGVTSIGSDAFSGCDNLIKVTIADTVTSIHMGAFSGCYSLKEIVIPSSITYISPYTFCYCPSLNSVTIPRSVTAIGEYAFDSCSTLTDVYYEGSESDWDNINIAYGNDYLTNATFYYNSDMSHEHSFVSVVTEPTCTQRGYTTYTCDCGKTYKDKYTAALGHSFVHGVCSNCGEVTPVVNSGSCGDNLTWELYESGDLVISGTGAMYDYDESWYGYNSAPWGSDIKTVVIEDGATSIGNSAFSNCYNVISVSMPQSVTSIGNWALMYCYSLKSVTIPDNVASIGDYAFAFCDSLSGIEIPDSVTSIGEGTFFTCSGLKTIVIGNGVNSIGLRAFASDIGLENITVKSENRIYISSGNCLIEKESKTLITGCKNSAIPTDGSVTSIGGFAFFNSVNLSEIVIPNGITSIGTWAFYGCNELKSVTIPKSVTTIADSAFGECWNLADVYYYGSESDWSKIQIGEENYCLKDATIHFDVVPPHIHDYTAVVTNPTCTEDGYTTFTCDCGDTYVSDYTHAFGHPTDASVLINVVDATCTNNGYTGDLYCNACKTVIMKGTVISAIGHTEGEWIIDTPATCTEAGVRYKNCTICGTQIIRETIPALGHDFVDGECTHCHIYQYTITVNYVYTDGTTVQPGVTKTLLEGEKYTITSPSIKNYVADKTIISGIATKNLNITVTYKKVESEIITSIKSISLGNINYNTPYSSLALPETVTGVTSSGKTVQLKVFWNSADYNATTFAEQIITGSVISEYGYKFGCEAKATATLMIAKNVVVSIPSMNLGKLPIGTVYDGLGMPETVAVVTDKGNTYYLPVVWDAYSYDSTVAGRHTIHGTVTLESGYVLGDGVTSDAEILFELSDTMYGTADIVFLIDTTGSMGDEITNVKNNIKSFADMLEREGVSVRWALIEYKDITCDGLNSTKIVYCGSSEWYIDVNAYKDAISRLTVNGGGDTPETVIDALKAATFLETRSDAYSFYIVVTDAGFKVNNKYGVSNMSQMINELKADETVASVVTKTRYYGDYKNLTDETGGILANIDGDFANELWKLSGLIVDVVVYGDVERIEITNLPSKTTYVSGDYFDGSGMNVKAVYSSGAEKIVTGYSVSPTKALSIADSSVEVNYRGKTATVAITVTGSEFPVTGVVVSPKEINMKPGEKQAVTATVTPVNASNKNVYWVTDNPNIATVKNGVVEAFEPGITNITVYTDDGGFSATVKVQVSAKEVATKGIYLDTGSIELFVGEGKKVNATVYPTDATDKTVVWSSENEDIATVDANGNISAVAKGTATVTATTADGKYVAMVLVTVGERDVEAPQYSIESAKGFIGKTVDIYIAIENNPGIISLRNYIAYDIDALELISVENTGLLGGYTDPAANIGSPYILRWSDPLALQNNLQNGNIVKLTFKIKEETPEGKYEISITPIESRNFIGQKIVFSPATSFIEAVNYIVGDSDGDGELSDWDAILLQRYLAGWDVDVCLEALDIDCDGEISDWDEILLERYLAGWTGAYEEYFR